MKKFKIPPVFYPLAAMLFWGLSFIWSTVLLKYYEPVTIIFIRLVISSALLFAFLYITGHKPGIRREDRALVLLSSLFNPFLYFLCETYGLKYSTPTISAVIIATIPVFSPIIAFLFSGERLSPVNFFGIAISFCGVVVMLVNPDMSLEADTRGILFLFAAVATALGYSVTLRKLTARYSSVHLVATQNLIGMFLFLPLFLVFEKRQAWSVPLNGEIIGSMLLLAVFASSAAFVFFAQSVRLFGISKANVFSNLIPVFTAVFSWLILSESFSLQNIAGIALVIGGVYLSERSRKHP